MNEQEKIDKLVKYFYKVCTFCDELDIYEHESFDESMQEMKEWVNNNFERK
jgi:hypothetical protein